MRFRSLLVAAATIAATLSVGLVAPVHADPGDIILVTSSGLTNSVAEKELIISCPPSSHVLGGGGSVWNGAQRVHLTTSSPRDGGINWTQWAVGAAEIRPGDYTGNWRLYGYAICGPSLPGLQFISAEAAWNSTPTRHARVTCPGTKRLLSAGGELADQEEHVVLDDIALTSDLRSADVWGIEREGGTSHSWTVGAYGVCVNNTAVANLHRVESTGSPSLTAKTQTATCGSQQVFGIGVSQAAAAGHTLLQAVTPSDSNGTASVTPDPTSAPHPWSLTTQLVCGDE